MKILQIEEQNIYGLSVRTTNADEMNSDKARIGALWQVFDDKVSIDYKNGSRVFGVYYNYESDAHGEFTVLAGSNQLDDSVKDLEHVVIPSGKYLVFEAKGEVPQVVIDVWGEIWRYFDSESSEYQRTFTADFEYYKNQNEIEICIAVK